MILHFLPKVQFILFLSLLQYRWVFWRCRRVRVERRNDEANNPTILADVPEENVEIVE